MIDFHCHILPQIDDGADSLATSLHMLVESDRQGIDYMIATPHFYAQEDSPRAFLARRAHAYERVRQAIEHFSEYSFPHVLLGAEILYYPGMAGSSELYELRLADTGTILIEPPMEPWRESMFREISQLGKNLGLVPVIAHVDRFQRFLKDDTLIDQVISHRMLVQVNASYFLHHDTAEEAVENLKAGKIHMLGSDCHNLDTRPQNIGAAAAAVREAGAARTLAALNEKGFRLLGV